mgnify:CR=1 FL=1
MGMYVYKMFDKGLKCRGYKFKMGVNECDHATCVKEGFHAAENPLDCLSYYPNWDTSECYVCYAEGIHEDGSDSKISCTHLEILKRLDIFEFIYEAVRYILEHPKRALNGNVYHEGAVESQDYNVSTASDWLKGGDGFYYYTKPIAPGYSSTAFPTVTAIDLDASNPKLNYNLVTTYVTAGVQASPTEVVNLAWGVTLDANGNITAVP